MQFDIFLI